MTPQEIIDALRKLHGQVDNMGFGEVRPAVKKAIECMFYLAKFHLPPEEAKSLKLSKPRKKKVK